ATWGEVCQRVDEIGAEEAHIRRQRPKRPRGRSDEEAPPEPRGAKSQRRPPAGGSAAKPSRSAGKK
ncbi:MAG TPA: hypothetical protein VMD59_03795, partial [Acidimicrobiales bacterium]|nr:hypothetical protein [Acidimicrobiales bacterium]